MLYLILDVKLGSTVCVTQQSDKMQEQQWGMEAWKLVPQFQKVMETRENVSQDWDFLQNGPKRLLYKLVKVKSKLP